MIRRLGFGDLVIRGLGIKEDKMSPISQSPNIQTQISKYPNNPKNCQYSNLTIEQFNNKMGFTIIELIMVIVIVGILAALAVPRFESFYSIKLNGAVKKVVSDIRFVQQLAVSRHTNTRLVFNTATESYTAQEEFPQGSGTWINITDPFTRTALISNFTTDPQYKGIDIYTTDFAANTLQFDWRGTPSSGGSIELRYQNNSQSISVEPNTGRVRVE